MPISYLDEETPGTITYLDEEPAPVIPPPVAPPIRDWRAAAAAQMRPLGAPVGLPERPSREEALETPEEQAKRAALAAEKRRVKGAGKLQELDLAAAKGLQTGAQILSRIFPTTAISDVAQRIGLRPIVPPEHVKQIREGVTAAIDAVVPRAQVPVDAPRIIKPELGEKINKGLTEFGDETISSFTSPEQAALLASGAKSPEVVGRLFQLGSILSVPEATQQLKEAVQSGDAKQITKAGAGLGMSLAIPAAIERGLTPKPAPPIPPLTPRVEPPRGVTVPERPPTVTETTPIVPRAEMPKTPTATGVRPAIRLVGGKVVVGDAGKTHPQIIKANKLKAEEIDQRGFVNERGEFMDREQTAAATGVPTEAEPARQHSTDLPEATPPPTEPTPAKEPWQMTQKEYVIDLYKKFRQQQKDALGSPTAYGTDTQRRKIIREYTDLIKSEELGYSEKKQHRELVEKAINEGKPVPPEVLADYPDLKPPPAPPPTAAPAAAAPENGRVVYRVPATGKSKTFIKWNGQWFKSKGGVTTGKPLDPDIGLTRALEAQLAKEQAKAPAPPPAAAKVETEVRKVAVTQGQRPAKEVKSELLRNIQSEIDSLPKPDEKLNIQQTGPRTIRGKKSIEYTAFPGDKITIEQISSENYSVFGEDYYTPPKSKQPITVRQYLATGLDLKSAKKLAETTLRENGGNFPWNPDKPITSGFKEITINWGQFTGKSGKIKTVTIDIPGDGTFTIPKTRFALEEMNKRVKALETAPSVEPEVPLPGRDKDLEVIRGARRAAEYYKSPIKAAALIRSQLSRGEFEPEQVKFSEAIADRLEDETQQHIQDLRVKIQGAEKGVEAYTKSVQEYRDYPKKYGPLSASQARSFAESEKSLAQSTKSLSEYRSALDALMKEKEFYYETDWTPKPITSQAAPVAVNPHDFRPAIQPVKGEPVIGEKGTTHNKIWDAQAQDWRDDNLMVMDTGRGFWYQPPGEKGRFVTRREAADLLGEKDDLHSERLAELQAATPEAPPTPPLAPGPGAQTIGEPPAKAQIEQLEEAFRNISGLRVPLPEKVKEAFNVGERVSGANTAVGKAIEGLKTAGDYLISLWKGVPKIDELLRSKGELSAEVEKRGWHVRKFIKTAAKAVPRAQDQAAIAKWIDAGGDAATLQRGLAEAPDKYKQAYRDALNLKGDLLISAQNAQNYFEARLQEAIDAGVLKEGVEDYLHRIYERTPERAERAIAYVQSALLKPNPSLARKRVFQWDWEAEKLGYKPVQSFIPRIAHYEASLSKAIASRQFIKRATEMKASDGRPIIDIKGVGIPLEDASGVREGTLIKPSFNPQRNTQPTLPDGTPNPNYRGDYVNREYPSLSRWKWAASDTAGNPIFVQGDVAIHPEFVGRVDSLLRPSLLRTGKQAKIFRPLMGISSTFKQTMLDLSGFHQVQITVHGLEHRVWALPTGAAPPGFAKIIKDIDFADPNVDGLLRSGITLGGEHYAPYREGLIGSALTRHIPILGPLIETYHNWLFQDYIPRIKMTMALHALERNRARYAGKMTDEQILFKTASEANAAFGELNYTMLERSQTARDISRLIMLAPDFLEARARFAGAAFQRGGKMFGHEQRTALLLGALTLWLTARVMNKMISGQYHDEPENAFAIVVNGKSYGLRTVQGDIMHAATKPVEFIMHRLNPVYTRIFVELASGRDEFGRKRTPLEAVWDTVSNIRPIALRSSRERSLWESMANAFGITARRYNEIDRAFKLAQAWKSKHGVQERGEFIYDPQKDPLRSLKLALVQNDDAGATDEIRKLLESKLIDRVKLNQYFSRYATMPFTGSKANDTKFQATLSEDERKTVEAAREHKKQINRLYRKALEKYDSVRSTGGAPAAGKVTYLD